MADIDPDDPLTQLEKRTVLSSDCEGFEGNTTLQLTYAGIRATLNRKVRSKPLLKVDCKGCGRNTHSPDTYIDVDFLELLGYVRLRPRPTNCIVSGFGSYLCL